MTNGDDTNWCKGDNDMKIYLDNAASAPLQQPVKDRLLNILDIYAKEKGVTDNE